MTAAGRPARVVPALVAAALTLAVGAAPATLARLVDGTTSSGAFDADTLDPPTSLTAIGGTLATLGWTPTVDGYASGYEVLRSATSGSGYAVVGAVGPAGATGTVDSPGGGTWYYVVRTVSGAWWSAPSNEATATIASSATTPLAPCVAGSAAPDTGGDGDGYEGSPSDACADDAAWATDSSSGTSTVDSCADAGKDRHRFWGFDLGLPASVASVDGIEVRLDAGMSNNGGTSRICVELSWDGGTSWTTARHVALPTASVATYVLGGPADAWGRTWTAAELDATSLRVRVTDVTTHPKKDFRLEYIALAVTYTP